MNKLVKGSIATAAGIALLMGGAGSLALWNDSTDVDAGTINSGTLTIASTGDGAWDETIAYIVPGDYLTYTETFEVVAIGDNLDAELESNIAALTSTIDGVAVTTDFTVLDGTTPVVPVAGVYSFADGTYTVAVEITVDFDDLTAGLDGQDDTLDLSDVTITLQQV
jgi:alternate signal-mediated exported protein